MAYLKVFLLAVLALATFVTAYDAPVNTSAPTTTTTTEDTGGLMSWSTLACSTAPGTNNSAVVYGSTYSIPVNYNTCDPNDPGCQEAGRRCGIVSVSTSVVPTTTSFIATSTPSDFTESVKSGIGSATTATTATDTGTTTAIATATATGGADQVTVDVLAFVVLTGMVIGYYGPDLY